MSQTEEWQEAFAIFAKYDRGDGEFEFVAEHDEVWFGPDPARVSDEDLARLHELGWNKDWDHGESFHKFV